jgi:NTP pyrophosphatase (non-canonical NTP hydrolase)
VAKYPGVCPYCRLPSHKGEECKEKRPDRREIDWRDVASLASRRTRERPQALSEWQAMFQVIYPRGDTTDHELNITRLSEELGELAEAIRVLPVAPQYFVSEAPDVFAWLMGFANQFAFDRTGPGETLEEAMERQYPGLCTTCGYSVCKCPPVPANTLGRIAKEAPVGIVFPSHPGLFSSAEAIKLFTDVEKAIVIGEKPIPVRREDVETLGEDIRKILVALKEQSKTQSFVSIQMAASLGKLETLATQGAVTQEAVENLINQIKALPPENRTALVGFLTSLSASALFQTILQASSLIGN